MPSNDRIKGLVVASPGSWNLHVLTTDQYVFCHTLTGWMGAPAAVKKAKLYCNPCWTIFRQMYEQGDKLSRHDKELYQSWTKDH